MPETLPPRSEQGERNPKERLIDAAAQLTDEFGIEMRPGTATHLKYLHLPREYYPSVWLELFPEYHTISVNHHLGGKSPDDPALKDKIITLAFKAQEGVLLDAHACRRLYVFRTDQGEIVTSGVNGYRAPVRIDDELCAAFADNFGRATADLRAQAAGAPQVDL